MELLIPYAHDGAGRWVSPAEADGLPGPWICSECGERVCFVRPYTKKDGTHVRQHFAHIAASDCAATGESVLHHWAADSICEQVRRAAAGEEAWPGLSWLCPECYTQTELLIPGTSGVANATREHRLASGRVADVAMLDADGNTVFVVEVVFAHAVDNAKRADLDMPWCEVDAEGYERQQSPWKITQVWIACEGCAAAARRQAAERKKLEEELLRQQRAELLRQQQVRQRARKDEAARTAAEEQRRRTEAQRRQDEDARAAVEEQQRRAEEQRKHEADGRPERMRRLEAELAELVAKRELAERTRLEPESSVAPSSTDPANEGSHLGVPLGQPGAQRRVALAEKVEARWTGERRGYIERVANLSAPKEQRADQVRRWWLNHLRHGSSTVPYTTAEVIAEFVRRGASIRPDGCIFTALGMNDAEFSYRTLAWLRAGGDIRLLKSTREIGK